MSLPITRLELLLGKYLGLAAALTLSTLAGFGLVAVLLVRQFSGAALFHYGGFMISSVLLGSRRYGTWEGDAGGAAAAVLREITPTDCAYEIRSADGSFFKAKSIEIDKGRLKATDAFDVSIGFNPAELIEITVPGQQ